MPLFIGPQLFLCGLFARWTRCPTGWRRWRRCSR
ncbi:hypothetical protein [Tessaracoccus coleopterorum]